MSENVNGISGSLFCHYGEIDDAFLIGGLVEPSETLMASAIRHGRRSVNFYLKPNHRLGYYSLDPKVKNPCVQLDRTVRCKIRRPELLA